MSDGVIQGSSAVFTVTLNPSLATSVSVNFSTANGSAVRGKDYTFTSEMLTFSPGMLEQAVTVPLLSSGNNPKKTFYGQLSSQTGAAVWVSKGSAIVLKFWSRSDSPGAGHFASYAAPDWRRASGDFKAAETCNFPEEFHKFFKILRLDS